MQPVGVVPEAIHLLMLLSSSGSIPALVFHGKKLHPIVETLQNTPTLQAAFFWVWFAPSPA